MTAITKYPARDHARKVVHELHKLMPEADRSKMHGIFVQAAPTECRHDTDRELPFRQEANFSYLTGSRTPSSSLLVFFGFEPGTSRANVHHSLLIPPADPAETMWSVPPPTLEEAKADLDSDNIAHLPDLTALVEGAIARGKGALILHTLPNTLEYPALPSTLLEHFGEKVQRCESYLLDALHIARLTKDEYEISLIREANRVSSGAHEVLMREIGRSGREALGKRSGKEGPAEWKVESEGDAEALFVATCRRAGAPQAYLPICASGSRASTLHYVCNDRLFPSTARAPGDASFTRDVARGCCGDGAQDDQAIGHFEPQVLLVDAGCEWKDYASDITRTMPVGNGGRFTQKAGEIYDIVLKMQKECEAMVRPGVHWDTIHLHAHTVLIASFLSLGVFTGDSQAILQSGITAAFFPHGLGHSLGIDVHDSRQYLRRVHQDIPDSSRSTPEKLYAFLRIRMELELGMVLTVEPGCYFAPQLMETHGVWDSPYVNKDKLREYCPVGGVRIEDVVVVRDGACENLTTAGREREWIEAVCAGKA